MTKSRKRGLALLVLGLAAAFEPQAIVPILDTIRFAAAEALSWPVRAPAQAIYRRRAPAADAEAEQAATVFRDARAEVDPGGDTVFGAPVVGITDDETTLIVLAGRHSGVERGSVVAAGDTVIGFVDRTEEFTSRVRLLAHPSTRFSGEIAIGPESPDAEKRRFLLRGVRHGVAETQEGSVLSPDLKNRFVRTIGAPGMPPGLLIGTVGFAERLGNLGVILAADPSEIDQVSIWSADASGRLPIRDADVFASLDAAVSLTADSGLGALSVMLSVGEAQGVEVGSWVSLNGRWIGRVTRLGRWECRIEPPIGGRGVPVIAVLCAPDRPADVRRLRWPTADPALEGAFFYVRSTEDLAPRGAFLARGGATDALLERFSALRPGDVVQVAVARHAEEIRTLLGRARR